MKAAYLKYIFVAFGFSSRNLSRPTLQHEIRVLRFLKGQAAIPAMYGYRQLKHFEYLAMEFLKPFVSSSKLHCLYIECKLLVFDWFATLTSTCFICAIINKETVNKAHPNNNGQCITEKASPSHCISLDHRPIPIFNSAPTTSTSSYLE